MRRLMRNLPSRNVKKLFTLLKPMKPICKFWFTVSLILACVGIILMASGANGEELYTNTVQIIYRIGNTPTTNDAAMVEEHHADGSVKNRIQVVTLVHGQGVIVGEVFGVPVQWPIERFVLYAKTNHHTYPKPIAPVLPANAADVQRGQSVDRRAESERNKPKQIDAPTLPPK